MTHEDSTGAKRVEQMWGGRPVLHLPSKESDGKSGRPLSHGEQGLRKLYATGPL